MMMQNANSRKKKLMHLRSKCVFLKLEKFLDPLYSSWCPG